MQVFVDPWTGDPGGPSRAARGSFASSQEGSAPLRRNTSPADGIRPACHRSV